MNQTPSNSYVSNPFKSTFRGFGNFFSYNQNIAIILLVLANVGMIFQLFDTFSNPSMSSNTSNTTGASTLGVPAAAIIMFAVFGLTVIVISFLFGCLVNGMVAYATLKTSRQETTTVKEAFRETITHFWSIVYASIIVTLKIIGGLLLFIIPGVRAALRYTMVLLPIFDEDANGKQAIQRMKFLTKDHLLEMFGIVTVAGIIPFIGTLLQWGGVSVMYPQLKTLKSSNAPKPPVHWLNYIGFIFVGFWILLIALFVALIIAITNVR